MQPIDQGMQAIDEWLSSRDIPLEEATGKLRRELREHNGGQMRVLASPELVKR